MLCMLCRTWETPFLQWHEGGMPTAFSCTPRLCWLTTCAIFIFLGISHVLSCTPQAQALKHLLLPPVQRILSCYVSTAFLRNKSLSWRKWMVSFFFFFSSKRFRISIMKNCRKLFTSLYGMNRKLSERLFWSLFVYSPFLPSFFFFSFKMTYLKIFNFIEVYRWFTMLVSGVLQSDSVIHIHVFILF